MRLLPFVLLAALALAGCATGADEPVASPATEAVPDGPTEPVPDGRTEPAPDGRTEPAPDGPTADPTPDGAAADPTPDDAAADPTPDADTVAIVLRGPDGDEHAFSVEVAADRSSRQLGLMHRTELAPDAGMLFLFPEDSEGGFWMKDTLIPLTIAFADAGGRVVAVLDMEPCPFETCPTYRPGVAYRMALEVNQGALDGVGPGWQLEVDGELPPAS